MKVMYKSKGKDDEKTIFITPCPFMGTIPLSELNDVVAKEFPRVPRKQLAIKPSKDQKVVVGFYEHVKYFAY